MPSLYNWYLERRHGAARANGRVFGHPGFKLPDGVFATTSPVQDAAVVDGMLPLCVCMIPAIPIKFIQKALAATGLKQKFRRRIAKTSFCTAYNRTVARLGLLKAVVTVKP